MLLPRLQVAAAALLFSTGGVVIKSSALASWQIASYRSAVAALVMLALVPRAARAIDRRTWLVGLAFGATLVLFTLANKATTAAHAVFLQNTAPLYLLLLAPWLLGERVRRRDLARMALLGLGMALMLGGGDAATATAPAPLYGNLLGAATGACWALTVLGLRWLGRAGGDAALRTAGAVVAGNAVACLLTLPRALALPVAPRPADLLIVVYLGAVQIALAYVFLNAGVRRVPALEASLLLLLEPVFGTFWAWLVHGEAPSAISLAGAALILLATAAQAAPRAAAAPIGTGRRDG
ncbi:MAG: EamA/RhaT family transporter [Acidobacteria bacterium]|nr:MAG: EamA/RhaT family transporter [Acidobacteriota bacterium]